MEEIRVVSREEVLENSKFRKKIEDIIEEFNKRENPDKFFVPDKYLVNKDINNLIAQELNKILQKYNYSVCYNSYYDEILIYYSK